MPFASQDSGDSGPTFILKSKGARGIDGSNKFEMNESNFVKKKTNKLSRISKMTGDIVEKNMRPNQKTEEDVSIRSITSHARSDSIMLTFQSNQKKDD